MLAGSRLDRALSIALTVATIVVAAVVVEGRLRPAQPVTPRTKVQTIEGWNALASPAQLWLTDSTRPVAVAIFTDFECPFCRLMDSVVTEMEKSYPNVIPRSLIHFPLSTPRFDFPAARAFECAARDGYGKEMQSSLMNQQHRLGLQEWYDFARESGVRDSARFVSCLKEEPSPQRIADGTRLGTRLKLSGTPAVVINGRLYDPAYIPDVMEAIENAAKGALAIK